MVESLHPLLQGEEFGDNISPSIAEQSSDSIHPLLQGDEFGDLQQTNIPNYTPSPLVNNNITTNQLKGIFPSAGETFDTAVRLDKGDIEWALTSYKGLSPDKAAKVQKIARSQEDPFESVVANQKDWEDWEDANNIYNSLLSKNEDGEFRYPYTAQWLSDPAKMAVSKDDIEALKEVETLLSRQAQKSEGFLKANSRAFKYGLDITAAGLAKIPAFAYSNAVQLTEGLTGADLEATPPDWLLNNPISKYFTKRAEEEMPIALEENLIEQIKNKEFIAAANNLALQVTANSPNTLLALSSFMFGAPGVGLGILGGIAGAGAFEEGIEEEKTIEQATTHGLLSGIAEAGFESIGTFGILRRLSKQITKNAGKAGAKAFFKELGLTIFQSAAQEGGEEVLTEQAQTFSDFITGDEEAYQGEVGRTLNAFLVGAASGGVLGGGGTVINNATKPSNFKKDMANFTELETKVAETKTQKRSPENTQEYIEKINEKVNTDSNIYLDNEGILDFFQKKPTEFNEFAEKVGIDKDLAEFQETGADVPVSKAKYLANYAGTELSLDMRPLIKFEPGGISLNTEAISEEEFNNQVDDLRVREKELVEDVAIPKQVQDIRTTLIDAGNKAADVDAQLNILMSGAKVLSKQRGETTDAWFNRVNPVVKIDGQIKQDKENIIRGGIQFAEGKTIINLFNSKNRSTFLHETAHIFSNDIQSLVKAGKADEQLQTDFNSIMEFVGADKEGNFGIEGEEKFARAFEAYLREGKAPSVKLATAFEKFKQWLSNIYRSIKDLNVEINDEIRGVFDRILASTDEIREAQTYYGLRQNLSDITEVTKTQKNKLDKKQSKATLTSDQLQISKSLKAFEKAVGGKQFYKDQATKEINAMPVYQALDNAAEFGKLNSNDIKDAHGEDVSKAIKASHPKSVIKKGEMSVAELAVEFDFESEQALIDAMVDSPKKQTAIDARALALQNQAEQNLNDVQEGQEEIPGENSIHNNDSLEFLIAEAQVLRDKISKIERAKIKKIESKALKAEAQNIIANKTVKLAVRYDLYAKTEQKYAKQTVNFTKKGDFVNAYKSMQKQTLNHALVQESIKARDSKLKIEQRYKVNKIETNLKNVENAFANIAKDLMAKYQLIINEKFQPNEENSAKQLEEVDEVLFSETPDWILNELDQGNYRDLKMSQLSELDESIRAIMSSGRDELSSLKDTKYTKISQLKEESIEAMSHLKDRRIATDNDNMFTKSFLNAQQSIAAPYQIIEMMADRLDNYKLRKTNTFGVFGELMNQGVAAEVKFNDIQESVNRDIAPSLEILHKAKNRINKQNDGRYFDIEGVPLSKVMQENGMTKWTFERIISFVLNMGNAGNFNALQNSFGYTDEQMNAVASQLTEEELNGIQNIWDGINKLFPQLDQVHFGIYNRHLQKVEAKPVTITNFEGKTVTLEGGYYPLQYDHTISIKAAQAKAQKDAASEDIMKNRNKNILRKTTPTDGFKYSRQPNVSLPPLLQFGVLISHINDTARYISHSEYLRDFNRLTLDPQWAESVKKKQGKKFYNEIRKSAAFQALPERNVQDAWDKGFDILRSLATTAILGLNVGVSALQRFSTIQAMNKIGVKYVLQGMRATDLKGIAFGVKSSKTYQDVINISGYMKIREGHISREISDQFRKLKFDSISAEVFGKKFTINDVKEISFMMIQMMDRATVIPIWKGAYQKFMDQNVKGEPTQSEVNDAIKFADNVVRTTQPSVLPIDLSSLQRAEGITRLFTSFMTFTFKLGNILTSEHRAWRDGAISNQEYAKHILFNVLISGVSVMLFRSLLYSGEIPDGWDWITAPIDQLLGTIPVARDIPGYFKAGRDVGQIPAFRPLNQTLKAIKSIPKGITGDKEWMKVWLDIGRAAEMWYKIPAIKMAQDIKRKYNNIENLITEGEF